MDLSAPDPGTWVQPGTTLVVTWTPGVDGSGVVTPYAAWTQITDTFPVTLADAATAHTETLATRGTWYFHLRGDDGGGNSLVRHHGPICVDDPDWPGWAVMDGLVDAAHGEWDADEYLGSDARSRRGAQSFYVTWDADDLYLAWQGARWDADGDLFFYFGTAASTTATMNYNGTHTLPFAADYAFYVEDESTYGLKHWSGTAWEDAASPGLEIAFDPTAGTEVVIPRSVLGSPSSLSLLAFAQEEETNQVWAVFPNLNPLGADLAFTFGFAWASLGQGVTPSAGQPIGTDLAVTLGATDYGTLGSSATVTYTLAVENESADSAPATVLTATAEGLAFTGVEGATCTSCSSGGSTWLLSLGDMTGGASHNVTLTAQVNLAAGAAQPVTTTVEVGSARPETDPEDNVAPLSHQADANPPQLALVDPAAGGAIRPGTVSIAGSASDETGVAAVQISLDGTTWRSITGTLAWEGELTIPNTDQVVLHLKGEDLLGNEATSQAALIVDGVAPLSLIALEEGAVLAGDTVLIYGVAYDSYPSGGEIRRVEISTDGGSIWEEVAIYRKGVGYLWIYEWLLPETSGSYILKTRATDAAGSEETPGAGVTVYVQGTVGHHIYLPAVLKAHSAPAVDSAPPTSRILNLSTGDLITTTAYVITGTASDAGSGVAQVELSTDGGTTWGMAVGTTEWSYTWVVMDSGLYTVTSRATDVAGNVEEPREKVYLFAQVQVNVQKVYLPLAVRNHQR